ncbi:MULTISPECIES: LCP family protein [Streptomyces]|uniref:LytR family transcriptional regulator n=2 Tax=Streptomyces TaxID=1883 RepID=A0ABQ7FQ93_9ACTN|nr:LCP family protein [Streptomyces lycii]KAF4410158.1 LytR family transcriptional regulator [Streptomyces lycii]
MDAQGRGRADDIDPADQWVLDPNTGNYVLRPAPPAGRQAPPVPSAQHRVPPQAPGPRASRRRAPVEDDEDVRPEVPPQRNRRAGSRAAAKAPGGRRKSRAKKSGKKRALYWTGGVMAFVVVAGAATAFALYNHFNDNISTVDIGDAGAATSDGPLNILVIGTDARTGKGNQGYGDAGSPGHADTTILFHVSEDRSNATAVSIPRDLITDIPDCPTKQEDGSTKIISGEQDVRFNTSLGQSGRDPGCTMRTVKEMTGLEVNHFMMADFNAVKTLSSAVGGVEVCLAKDIDDPKSHLKLPAGKHTLKGEDALAFVRTRASVGNGGDLSRIEIQQQFLSSMIRKMKSGDTLTDPGKLWDLATAATKALTVDTGIGTINKLKNLAQDISRVDTKNITFATVPVIDNPAETVKTTVVLNEKPAEQLFSMMREDISLTEVKKKEKAAKDKQEKAKTEGPKADPSEVRVEVLNGGGPIGAAQSTLEWLQNTEGVRLSSNGGNAPGEKQDKTTLEYAPNQADQARALAEMMGLPASALKPGSKDAAADESMTLTLGADFTAAGEPVSAPSKAPEDMQRVEADKSVCAE